MEVALYLHLPTLLPESKFLSLLMFLVSDCMDSFQSFTSVGVAFKASFMVGESEVVMTVDIKLAVWFPFDFQNSVGFLRCLFDLLTFVLLKSTGELSSSGDSYPVDLLKFVLLMSTGKMSSSEDSSSLSGMWSESP